MRITRGLKFSRNKETIPTKSKENWHWKYKQKSWMNNVWGKKLSFKQKGDESTNLNNFYFFVLKFSGFIRIKKDF